MKKLLTICSILTISAFIFGCATTSSLQSGGVYSGDPFIYNADNTILTTYNILDAFLIFETQNEQFIKTNEPAIFSAANIIRQNAPAALSDISKARQFYLTYSKNTNTVLVAQAQVGLTSAISELQNQTTNVSPTVTSTPAFTNILTSLSTNTVNSVLP